MPAGPGRKRKRQAGGRLASGRTDSAREDDKLAKKKGAKLHHAASVTEMPKCHGRDPGEMEYCCSNKLICSYGTNKFASYTFVFAGAGWSPFRPAPPPSGHVVIPAP